MEVENNGFGVASLTCGILSVIFFLMLINIPLVVAAILFGIMQLVFRKKKIMAILGMSAAFLSILLMLAGWTAIFYGTSRADPDFMRQFGQDLLRQSQMDEYQ